MSAISFAKHAFGLEKPFSSITNWVDILTGPGYEDEAYDGIPELVDSINLQAAGPAEASRAIRKKLKHGDSHQQYRALVILKALVENCGHKFQTTFADGHLTDALKNILTDPSTNPKVKKKLVMVITSWNTQFKNDPYMSFVSGLYKLCHRPERMSQQQHQELQTALKTDDLALERAAAKEYKEAKARAKLERAEKKEREREKARREEEERRAREKDKTRRKRAPFNFEQEKPQILSSIASASQASSNLVNAITLVNPETDSLQSNHRVQECLTVAKQTRKQIVRYIQLVENEDLIGTLIETNERIIAAIEMYDKLTTTNSTSSDVTEAVAAGLAAAHISAPEGGELTKLQDKQRMAVERAKGSSFRGKSRDETDDSVHPDLQDLEFGALGSSSNNLPAPLRPARGGGAGGREYADGDEDAYRRGSLSDFSDYESSDEEMHNAGTSSTRRRGYVDVSDNSEDEEGGVGAGEGGYAHTGHGAKDGKGQGQLVDVEDPFADPFADEVAVSSHGAGAADAKRW